MVMKVVIPAAGLGTRLLPATKEQPKEMLPIFTKGAAGQVCLKPLLQVIFENLHNYGFTEFCFIIGRGKRAIEDHLTQDHDYLDMLRNKRKDPSTTDLESFYDKLKKSDIIWVNQPEPKGFGDAVLRARPFIGTEEFLVHAGDTHIISNGNAYLKRLIGEQQRLDADVMLLLQEIANPKQYGIAEVGKTNGDSRQILKVVEKPEKPTTNLAIMPVYVFKPEIFKALEETTPGKAGEIQLTDAIETLIKWNFKVHAVNLAPDDIRLDIGNPEMYWEALKTSYKYAQPESISQRSSYARDT